MTVTACDELVALVGTTRACGLSGRSKATHYRALAGPRHGPRKPRDSPSNALSDDERQPSSGRRMTDHKRSGALPQVDPGRALEPHPVAQHPGVPGLTGDVGTPAADQPRDVASRHAGTLARAPVQDRVEVRRVPGDSR